MDFDLTEEQKMLKANVRNFLEKEIVPIVDEQEKKGPLDKATAVSLIQQLIPLGYLVGFLPEEYGGSVLRNPRRGAGQSLEQSYRNTFHCRSLLVALERSGQPGAEGEIATSGFRWRLHRLPGDNRA